MRVPRKIRLRGQRVSTPHSEETLGEEVPAPRLFPRRECDYSLSRSTPPKALPPERRLLSLPLAWPIGRQLNRVTALHACARPCGHRAPEAIQTRSQKCNLRPRYRSARLPADAASRRAERSRQRWTDLQK